jgi:thioredoxin-dependent peroxiredoxin
MSLKIGNKLPDFSVKNQRGETVTSASILGKKTVLYFYPKDATPGCTTQACDLRDNYEMLQKEGYQVFGISIDNEKSHLKFIEKYNLPFDLWADIEHELVNAFGVWVEKNMYGRAYMGTARTTFIIDENGIIQEIIEKVKTKEHSTQILSLQ